MRWDTDPRELVRLVLVILVWAFYLQSTSTADGPALKCTDSSLDCKKSSLPSMLQEKDLNKEMSQRHAHSTPKVKTERAILGWGR